MQNLGSNKVCSFQQSDVKMPHLCGKMKLAFHSFQHMMLKDSTTYFNYCGNFISTLNFQKWKSKRKIKLKCWKGFLIKGIKMLRRKDLGRGGERRGAGEKERGKALCAAMFFHRDFYSIFLTYHKQFLFQSESFITALLSNDDYSIIFNWHKSILQKRKYLILGQ